MEIDGELQPQVSIENIPEQNSHGCAVFVRLVFDTTSQEHHSAVATILLTMEFLFLIATQRDLGSPLIDDRPIMNAVKYRVVSGVVWTNMTMVSSSTDTNRTGVLSVPLDLLNSTGDAANSVLSKPAVANRTQSSFPETHAAASENGARLHQRYRLAFIAGIRRSQARPNLGGRVTLHFAATYCQVTVHRRRPPSTTGEHRRLEDTAMHPLPPALPKKCIFVQFGALPTSTLTRTWTLATMTTVLCHRDIDYHAKLSSGGLPVSLRTTSYEMQQVEQEMLLCGADCSVVGGSTELRSYGVMERWIYDIMKQWSYIVMDQWRYGVMDLWSYGMMHLWSYRVMEQIEHVITFLPENRIKTGDYITDVSEGLFQLLFKNFPKEYRDTDLEKYKELVCCTNVNNCSGDENHSKLHLKSNIAGSGIHKDDVSDQLKLSIALRESGNNSHTNKITYIIEELMENVCNTNEVSVRLLKNITPLLG
ncbi:hypothetical protein PR048_030172 [Dryococelus australis]|uniref:DUF8207 domain-containing protein n=1 Tax=Dryococelus australis TaxID=614101 RepID=A0ABQ9GB27_9NEOP|nr:hypothetical protein PR048_030172 [Dryococelus australis]